MEGLVEALKSGWVAPVGPQLDHFENQLRSRFGYREVLAVNSGTSALHLALHLAGVGQGDHVLIGTFTFIAVANAVFYQKAIPIFIDSDAGNWNVCPELLRQYLKSAKVKPKAVVATHIFGIPAKIDEIKAVCEEYEVALIEDAAEALGSSFDGVSLGTFGQYGVLSFNGNKIITTSGGGALICASNAQRSRALYLSTQAKEKADHFSHSEVGYNYRMSNLLAGLGLTQMSKFDEIVRKKNELHNKYREAIKLDGVTFYSESPKQTFNHWITPIILDGIHPSEVLRKFEEENIEARRFWKPLHLQNVCKNCAAVENGIAEQLFDKGLCLPSGIGMTDEEVARVSEVILSL